MPLREIAPGLWMLPLMPRENLNVYLVGDVVVDSGAGFTYRRLLRGLAGRSVAAHAITHAHPDHQGGSHALCEERDIPLWCGAGDRMAAESGSFVSVAPPGLGGHLAGLLGGPGHPVERVLAEGDAIGDFEVVETPGHTPGHISFWRQRDGVVILGDVAFHRSPTTFRAGLREPFRSVTRDLAQNRRSARRIAELRPRLVCFGHGGPIDGGAFLRWAAGLPCDG